jgi:hypothetical protein
MSLSSFIYLLRCVKNIAVKIKQKGGCAFAQPLVLLDFMRGCGENYAP